MRSMIAARVVDLPEPVGPVTSTRPCCMSASAPIAGGRLSFSSGTMSSGIMRKTAAAPFSCRR
jgi:hypothetical protein